MQRRSLYRSFADAFTGFAEAWLTERNMRIHTFLALLALAAGHLGALSRGEWLLLSLVIALVFAAELINTSIEAVVDLATTDFSPLARTAKNAAAAAVLITAAGAIAGGVWLFASRLASFPTALAEWWRTAPLGLALWGVGAALSGLAALWSGVPKHRR